MTNRDSSGLVVLEGRWEKDQNISVKSLFDVLIDMRFSSSHNYYYSQFTGAEDLKLQVSALFRKGSHQPYRYLYIGSHGNEEFIRGSVEEISRTQLRNVLRNGANRIRGLFLGTCLFGSEDNIDFLFRDNPELDWVAGYSESIDWIESSVLDLMFWTTLFDNESSTEIDTIKNTCGELHQKVAGLSESLKFGVRRRGRGNSEFVSEKLYGAS